MKQTCIEIAEGVGKGEVGAREVVESYLSHCEEREGLNALTHVARGVALADADAIDAKVASGGGSGRLCGVPIAVKDAICTRGLPTTAGSRILQRRLSDGTLAPWCPPYDATVIERLRAEGAIVLGKANMDEFAMGSSNETSAYGPVKNPADESRIPGGSSGGSAVAVAAGLVPAALGSDTGGSIRQPASLCGVVGVKPTYGRVSRYGLIAFASSLDQIGPMTPDVRSSARLLEVMAGDDARDSTTSSSPVGRYESACDKGFDGMRFGLPQEYFAEGLDPSVRAVIDEVVEKIRTAGCEVKPVSMPHTDYGVATYYVLATAEASSNLARFDGVRFGLREEAAGGDLAELYEASRTAGFGEEVKRRILLGTYALSAGYYDAYYGKAQRVRTLIRRDFDAAFEDVDALLTPTSPTAAFKLGEKMEDPLAMYLADVFTLPASLAGVPGASVPVGEVAVEGTALPVGLQILTAPLAEERMFQAAAAIEALVGGK